MGLTTFAGMQPTLKEAVVAKNYLNKKGLRAMGRLVHKAPNAVEQRKPERKRVSADCGNGV